MRDAPMRFQPGHAAAREELGEPVAVGKDGPEGERQRSQPAFPFRYERFGYKSAGDTVGDGVHNAILRDRSRCEGTKRQAHKRQRFFWLYGSMAGGTTQARTSAVLLFLDSKEAAPPLLL